MVYLRTLVDALYDSISSIGAVHSNSIAGPCWPAPLRPEAVQITLGILLILLPVVAIAPFFAPGILTPDPPPGTKESFAQGYNRTILTPTVFALEAAALLLVLGLVELVLLIWRKRQAKS